MIARVWHPLIAIAIISVTVATALTQGAFAVDTGQVVPQGITMSPSSTQVTIEPGVSAARSFKLVNSGTESINVDTSVSPYGVDGLNYDPRFTQLPGTKSPVDWVSLSTDQVVIEPGQTSEINYSINVPQGTAPGGYYAVVFASASPADPPAGGIVPNNRVGNVLYITVAGDVKQAGELSGTKLDAFNVRSSLSIGIFAKNNGGVHFISDTKLNVVDVFGNSVFEGSLERFILPQTERLVEAEWKPASPLGVYKVSRSATIAGEQQNLPDKWVVVMKPWFFGMVLTVIALAVLYFTARRKNGKRTRRKTNVKK